MEHIYFMVLFIHLREQVQAQHAGVWSTYLITLSFAPVFLRNTTAGAHVEIWGRIHFFFLSFLVTFKKRINKSSSSSNILGKPGSHIADMPQKRLRQYKFSFHKCTTHLCSYIMATQLTKRTPRNMRWHIAFVLGMFVRLWPTGYARPTETNTAENEKAPLAWRKCCSSGSPS